MKGSDIVKHIAEELPKYTNLFSKQIPVTALTSTGGVATVEFASARTLTVGKSIFITGVKPYVDITSIVRENRIVTVITAQAHGLPEIDNRPNSLIKGLFPNTITIENAVPVEYNGTWNVYTSLDENTITFKINTSPTTPAITNGRALLKDFDNFNGLHEITEVVNATTYKYSLKIQNNLPITGNIFDNQTRVSNALSLTNIVKSYSKNTNKEAEKWVYVTLSGGDLYKSDFVPSSDPSATHQTGEAYERIYRKAVNIYAMIPYDLEIEELEQGEVADEIHNVLLPALQSTLANYVIPSPYKQNYYEGLTFVSDDIIEDVQDGTFTVFQMTFTASVRITSEDVYSFAGGYPLKEVDLSYQSGIESKINFP